MDATAEFFQKLNDPTRWIRVRDGNRPYYGIYRCICGTEKEIYDYTVRKGQSKSCGCLRSEVTTARNIGNKHGLKHGGCGTPEYQTWEAMHARCGDSEAPGCRNWAGRGIRVCDRWSGSDGFVNFLADMGPRPSPRHSIDRVDNDGNYEPDNCRWATKAEQLRNTRRNWRITYQGRTQCMADWCEELGINRSTLTNRLVRGWSVERAFTTPVQPHAVGV